MRLYDYANSSSAFRVRIALEWKGLEYERVPIHLLRGEQNDAAYLAQNPQGLVPLLVHGDVVISQSLAIVEYLDEIAPEPPLLPADPPGRARVRQLAGLIASEMQPLQNLRVIRYLSDPLGASETQQLHWFQHWIGRGFAGLEHWLATSRATGRFCHGDQPTLADVCLVPQLRSAERRDLDLSRYPTVRRIGDACLRLDAFQRAATG